jgi:hypothetical protein
MGPRHGSTRYRADGGVSVGSNRMYLLGLIHGHWDIKEKAGDAIVIDEASADEGTINMGMAIVIPFYKITEVLGHPHLKAERAKFLEQRREQNLPTPDVTQKQ